MLSCMANLHILIKILTSKHHTKPKHVKTKFSKNKVKNYFLGQNKNGPINKQTKKL